MKIKCAVCGREKEFECTPSAVLGAVLDGWDSYGNALYCPECAKKQDVLYGRRRTVKLIETMNKQGARM